MSPSSRRLARLRDVALLIAACCGAVLAILLGAALGWSYELVDSLVNGLGVELTVAFGLAAAAAAAGYAYAPPPDRSD